jgi:hypothetical protein
LEKLRKDKLEIQKQSNIFTASKSPMIGLREVKYLSEEERKHYEISTDSVFPDYMTNAFTNYIYDKLGLSKRL